MSDTQIELDSLLAWRRHAGAVDLTARRRVMTDLGGTRLSGFRGRGMEFDEHRVYQPGDEMRTIDWRVTARTGDTHVKIFREERERPVLLAVDLRSAMRFGTRGCFKSVLAARAAALCAWSAEANGDRVGGLCFSSVSHTEVRPTGGRRGLFKLMRSFVAAGQEPQADAANIATSTDEPQNALVNTLKRLIRTARGGSLVALFSDYRGLDAHAEDLLLRLGHQTELIIGFVHDPIERALPRPGRYPLDDARGTHTLNTADRASRQRWARDFAARQQALQRIALTSRAHWLSLPTDAPLLDSMALAFGRRQRVA